MTSILDLCGWAGRPVELGGRPELVAEAFELWSSSRLMFSAIKTLSYQAGARSMLWEVGRKILGTDPPNYAQEIGDPFVAGTMVLMADGSEKAIENIQIGDMVINHKNQSARVHNVIKKNFTGDLVTIKIKGWPRTVTATETHTGLYLPYNGHQFKYQGFKSIKFGDYKVGDYVHLSYGINSNESIVFDIKDYVENAEYDDKYVWVGCSEKIHRWVALDSRFARFIGLYLAEGGCNESSVVLSGFFKSLLGKKSIPKECFRCSTLIKRSLLLGWLDADGFNRASSSRLIHDIVRLALSCEVNPRDFTRQNSAPAYQPERTPYGFARKISAIERDSVVNHPVYCITTENEYTITCNGINFSNCVSFGAKNAIEYVQFYPIANGTREKWTRVFPPYLYGCGRIFIGKGKMGSQDGSVGAWQAQAVQQYGTIPIDAPNCPSYSGAVAKQWGAGSGPPQEFVSVGKEHLVKSAAAVQSWEDVVSALTNGYPCTIASNVGFDMTARADGFHHYSTHWGHQMSIIGVDDDASEPLACILNSWGDVHGEIKDFKTGDIWPKGTLRVRRKDVEAILAENDSFAYSALMGFPAQTLPDDLFVLW